MRQPSRTDAGSQPQDASQRDSGPVIFDYDYSFTEGGPVEEGRVPGVPEQPVPFAVARWQLEPGTSNDRDVHNSEEMWLVIDGRGELALGQQNIEICSGDAIMMRSRLPHRVKNIGDKPLRVFSVYWLPNQVAADRRETTS